MVERVAQSVSAARDTFRIDQKLQSNEDAILQATLRQRELTAAQKDPTRMAENCPGCSPGKGCGTHARWQLLATVTRLADYSPVWMNVLNTQPEAGANTQAYLDWIDQTLPLLETEAETMQPTHRLPEPATNRAGGTIFSSLCEKPELFTEYRNSAQRRLSAG